MMSADRLGARLIATWFGCGYWPWGPGTVGSLAAVLIASFFDVPPATWAFIACILLGPAIWAAGKEATESGREDPGHVVVDEVAGLWVTLAGAAVLNWKSLLAAFLLFRLFDIWKPPPVRQLEDLPGGIGIMADDIMAGLYGAAILALAGRLNLY
jgi:phosphatidylglycerophosphatase A